LTYSWPQRVVATLDEEDGAVDRAVGVDGRRKEFPGRADVVDVRRDRLDEDVDDFLIAEALETDFGEGRINAHGWEIEAFARGPGFRHADAFYRR
jgi:hypothetical protein